MLRQSIAISFSLMMCSKSPSFHHLIHSSLFTARVLLVTFRVFTMYKLD